MSSEGYNLLPWPNFDLEVGTLWSHLCKIIEIFDFTNKISIFLLKVTNLKI